MNIKVQKLSFFYLFVIFFIGLFSSETVLSSPNSVNITVNATVVSPTCSLKTVSADIQNGFLIHDHGSLYPGGGVNIKETILDYGCDSQLSSVKIALTGSGEPTKKILQDDDIAKVELEAFLTQNTDKKGFNVKMKSYVTPYSAGEVHKTDTLIISYN